jgi:hypothetical protein
MASSAAIVNLTLTPNVKKTTILQHGDLRCNFKRKFELYLNNMTVLQYGALNFQVFCLEAVGHLLKDCIWA